MKNILQATLLKNKVPNVFIRPSQKSISGFVAVIMCNSQHEAISVAQKWANYYGSSIVVRKYAQFLDLWGCSIPVIATQEQENELDLFFEQKERKWVFPDAKN